MYAQSPPAWVYASSMGGTSADDAADLTTDNNGNVYVIGSFQSNTMEVGSLTATNRGGKDIYVAKYSPMGVPIWLKTYGSTTEDIGYAITCDGTNVYWAGTYTNNLYYNATNFEPISGIAGKPNIAVVKLDASGTVIWTTHSGGEGFLAYSCYPNDIQLLNGGGVVVAGNVDGEMKWGTTAVGFTVRDTCSDCGFITRYGTNTGEYEWTYVVRAPDYENDFDCAVSLSEIGIDNNNNIYAIGNSVNRIVNKPTKTIFPNLPLYGVGAPGMTTLAGQGQFDFYVVRIAADGLFSWVKNGGFGSPGNYFNYYTNASTIWVDKASQEMYFGGSFRDSYYYSGSATGSTSSPGGNAFLIKADLNGNLIWEKHSTTTSTSGGNIINHISGNGKGGVYMGISVQTDCDWYGHIGTGDINSFSTAMLARIESDGSTRYTKTIDAGGFHYVYPPAMRAISSATTDECWVAGPHSGFGIYFDTYLVTGNNYSADGYVAKLGTSSPTAISQANLTAVNLYPNPSQGNFVIQLPLTDKGEIFIFDATGRIAHHQAFDNVNQIKVETSLPKGMYFVQVMGEKAYQGIKWCSLGW